MKKQRSRFSSRKNSILNGFLSVFALSEHNLEAATREILSKDIATALNDDRQAIANDFSRIFNREIELVDVK